jgi:hypothetical protein
MAVSDAGHPVILPSDKVGIGFADGEAERGSIMDDVKLARIEAQLQRLLIKSDGKRGKDGDVDDIRVGGLELGDSGGEIADIGLHSLLDDDLDADVSGPGHGAAAHLFGV